jgi:hypothetical protein
VSETVATDWRRFDAADSSTWPDAYGRFLTYERPFGYQLRMWRPMEACWVGLAEEQQWWVMGWAPITAAPSDW